MLQVRRNTWPQDPFAPDTPTAGARSISLAHRVCLVQVRRNTWPQDPSARTSPPRGHHSCVRATLDRRGALAPHHGNLAPHSSHTPSRGQTRGPHPIAGTHPCHAPVQTFAPARHTHRGTDSRTPHRGVIAPYPTEGTPPSHWHLAVGPPSHRHTHTRTCRFATMHSRFFLSRTPLLRSRRRQQTFSHQG